MAGIYFISGIAPQPLPQGSLLYLGQTKRELLERLEEHVGDLAAQKHSNQIIQNFYNQFGAQHVVTGAVIECSSYYLNTMEKSLIRFNQTYTGQNVSGWNKTKGGEGAKRNAIPYALAHTGEVHWGDDLNQFLTANPALDPTYILDVVEGKRQEYAGWIKHADP